MQKLTKSSEIYMVILSGLNSGKRTIDIARYLGYSKSRISQMTKKLDSWCCFRSSGKDNKRKFFYLCEEAEEVLKIYEPVILDLTGTKRMFPDAAQIIRDNKLTLKTKRQHNLVFKAEITKHVGNLPYFWEKRAHGQKIAGTESHGWYSYNYRRGAVNIQINPKRADGKRYAFFRVKSRWGTYLNPCKDLSKQAEFLVNEAIKWLKCKYGFHIDNIILQSGVHNAVIGNKYVKNTDEHVKTTYTSFDGKTKLQAEIDKSISSIGENEFYGHDPASQELAFSASDIDSLHSNLLTPVVLADIKNMFSKAKNKLTDLETKVNTINNNMAYAQGGLNQHQTQQETLIMLKKMHVLLNDIYSGGTNQ